VTIRLRTPDALRGTRWRLVCVSIAVAVITVALNPARQAAAHASLQSTLPADGVTVPNAPKTFTLEFNEPVSPLVMRLVRPNGQISTLTDVSAQNKTVAVVAPEMAELGSYVLSWRVVSADGHPVGGVVSFSVGHQSSTVAPPPVEGAAAVHAAIWAVQFVLALGLYIGAGGAFFVAWLTAKTPFARQGILVALMTCGLAATLASIPLQGLDALAKPLSDLLRPEIWAAGFATSWGVTAVVAAAALVAGSLALGFDNRALARVLAFLALAGIGLALVTSGHASTAEPRFVTIPAIFLHGVCVTFWIGSLLPLTVTVRGGDSVALERFSRLIPVPLILLIASGVVLAFVQLDRPDALWTTAYGRVLSIKIALVLVLLALGTLNRYALAPRLMQSGPRQLIAIITTEFVLAVAILGIVGLWRFTAPPVALATAETTFVHFHGEQAMTSITLKPVRDRGASLSILITDTDEHPIAAKEVDVSVWNPSAGIEPIRRSAGSEGDGKWRIDGLHIPVAGVWRMSVEILVSDFDKVMLEDNVELPRVP
jgi:copper transport protein